MKIQVQESQSQSQIEDDLLIRESTENLSDEGQMEQSTLHYTWFMRTFGPMKKGSLRQSIIALVCTAMGSGMLALPSNPRVSGLGACIVIMLLCALLARFSMYLLMKCSFQTGIDSYASMIKEVIGKKTYILYSIDVILYIFGSITGYQVLFIQFLWQVFEYFKMNPDYKVYVRYIGGISFILLNFPVCMLKDVYSLRYFTHLQILIIIYSTIAIIVHFFMNFNTDDLKNRIVWFDFNIYITCSFATTFFGFICHQLIFPVRKELHRSTFKRMGKIFNRAISLEFLIYASLMCFGYLTWFETTADVIVDNYTDVVFTISKGLFALVMYFAVPINLNPARLTILQLLDKEESKPHYTATTIALLAGSGGLAIIYPEVKSIFGLLGGLFGMIMAAVLPSICFAICQKQKGIKMSHPSVVFTFIVCGVSSLIGFTGATLSQFKKEDV